MTAALAGPAMGQDETDQPDRPASARRVVRLFDFEERAFNLEPVPRQWVRGQDTQSVPRPGFSPWNQAAFSDAHAHDGAWSVRLPAKGGSASLKLASGVLPVLADADYLISGYVRTGGVLHARAGIVARFLDQAERPIPGAEVMTALIASEGVWTRLAVELPGNFKQAAWMQLELVLLQPKDQPHPAGLAFLSDKLEQHRVWQEDYNAAADFDTVGVFLAPRVDLQTNTISNVIVAPDEPVITTFVRDLTGEALTGRLELRDERGRVLDATEARLDPSGRPYEWRPKVEGYGRRVVTLHISGDGQLLHEAHRAFIWSPATKPVEISEAQRFGVLLTHWPAGADEHFLATVAASRSGAAHVPLWRDDTTIANIDDQLVQIASAVEALLDRNLRVAFALDPIPRELAARLRVDPSRSLDVLSHDPQEWSQYIAPALARFGQRVKRWRFGDVRDATAFWTSGIEAHAARAVSELRRLAPSPVLLLPWRIEQRPPTFGPGVELTARFPYSSPAGALETYVSQHEDSPLDEIVISPPPTNVYAGGSNVAELAKRVVHARRRRDVRVVIEQPWRWEADRRVAVQPAPEFAVWRRLIEHLAERRFVGAFPSPPGTSAFLFEGSASGLMVAWADWPGEAPTAIEAYLGPGPLRAYDIWGNASPVEISSGRARIPLSDAPVFIEGVEVPLAQFQASLRFTPPKIPALATKHEVALEVTNPFSRPISGALRISKPDTWRVVPRVLPFSLAPEETAQLPFELSFVSSEETGMIDITAELVFESGPIRGYYEVKIPFEIGLDEVDFLPILSQSGDDAVVTLLVTNVGSRPLTLEGSAQALRYPREQAQLSDVAPGETRLVRWVFPGGWTQLSGSRVRVSVEEIGSLARLNKTISIP